MLDNRMKMLEKRQEGEDEVKEEEKVDDEVVEEKTVDEVLTEEGKEVERDKTTGLTFDDDE